MGNYAKRDARQRQTVEMMRRWDVVKKMAGLPPGTQDGFGVWLFCSRCGSHKIADSEWFFNRAKVCDDPMAQLAARVSCRKCRTRGVHAILASGPLRSLPIKFLSHEGVELLLTDPRMPVD